MLRIQNVHTSQHSRQYNKTQKTEDDITDDVLLCACVGWPAFLSHSFRLWLTHKSSVVFIWSLVPYFLPSPSWWCEIFAFHLHVPASALILVTRNCCWSSVSNAMFFFSSKTLDSKQRTSSVLAVFSFFSTCISNFIWSQSLDNFLLVACNSFILALCRQKHKTL